MDKFYVKVEGVGTANQVASRLRDLARAIDEAGDAGEESVDLKKANLDNVDDILYIEVTKRDF